MASSAPVRRAGRGLSGLIGVMENSGRGPAPGTLTQPPVGELQAPGRGHHPDRSGYSGGSRHPAPRRGKSHVTHSPSRSDIQDLSSTARLRPCPNLPHLPALKTPTNAEPCPARTPGSPRSSAAAMRRPSHANETRRRPSVPASREGLHAGIPSAPGPASCCLRQRRPRTAIPGS